MLKLIRYGVGVAVGALVGFSTGVTSGVGAKVTRGGGVGVGTINAPLSEDRGDTSFTVGEGDGVDCIPGVGVTTPDGELGAAGVPFGTTGTGAFGAPDVL